MNESLAIIYRPKNCCRLRFEQAIETQINKVPDINVYLFFFLSFSTLSAFPVNTYLREILVFIPLTGAVFPNIVDRHFINVK